MILGKADRIFFGSVSQLRFVMPNSLLVQQLEGVVDGTYL
jgi:hypothetical protein